MGGLESGLRKFAGAAPFAVVGIFVYLLSLLRDGMQHPSMVSIATPDLTDRNGDVGKGEKLPTGRRPGKGIEGGDNLDR